MPLLWMQNISWRIIILLLSHHSYKVPIALERIPKASSTIRIFILLSSADVLHSAYSLMLQPSRTKPHSLQIPITLPTQPPCLSCTPSNYLSQFPKKKVKFSCTPSFFGFLCCCFLRIFFFFSLWFKILIAITDFMHGFRICIIKSCVSNSLMHVSSIHLRCIVHNKLGNLCPKFRSNREIIFIFFPFSL